MTIASSVILAHLGTPRHYKSFFRDFHLATLRSDQSGTLYYIHSRAFCRLIELDDVKQYPSSVKLCTMRAIGNETILMHTPDVALTLDLVVAFTAETCSVTGLPITEVHCRRCTTCSACSLIPEHSFALQAVVGRDGKPESPRNAQIGIGRTDWIVSTLLEGAVGCVICGSRWILSAGYAL